jgi:hypothetical protein
VQPAVGAGKPKTTSGYRKLDLEGLELYVSKSLGDKQYRLDLSRFMFWKWLNVTEK